MKFKKKHILKTEYSELRTLRRMVYRASSETLRALRVAHDFSPKIFPKETRILRIRVNHIPLSFHLFCYREKNKPRKRNILSIPIPGQFPASYITLGWQHHRLQGRSALQEIDNMKNYRKLRKVRTSSVMSSNHTQRFVLICKFHLQCTSDQSVIKPQKCI